MIQHGNLSNATKRILKTKPSNNVTGNGTESVWSALQGTPAQMGIDYAVKVFANQNLTPGAEAALQANPPFRFYVNGQQILLPPAVVSVGQAVPMLPDGIQVLWAPYFMGVPIPSDMIGPYSKGGRLTIEPLEIMSAGGDGSHTNAALVANNKVLLNLLMSVMGALINCYSSHPYSDPNINKGAFGTLSHYILDLRDKADFLSPQPDKGSILQQAVSTIAAPYAYVAGTVANAVAPGSGPTVSKIENGITGAISGGAGKTQVNNVNKSLTTSIVPGSVITSPVALIGIGLVVVIIIYLVIRNSK